MKISVRILFYTFIIVPTVLMKAQEMRPYYHSFNSAPPASFSLKPTKVIVSKPRTSIRGVKAVYDSSDFYVWDSILVDWRIKSKVHYQSYDSNKNLLGAIGMILNNGVWENSYKHMYTYDSKNNVTSKVYYTWQGGSWVKFKKESHAYNNHNDLISYIVTQFNGSSWINVTKSTFTYDNHNNKLKETYQDGSSSGTGWVNNYQYIYEYDSTDNRLNETYQLGNDSIWISVAKWNYVYDNNHNRISEHYLNWDFSAGAFVNAALFTYQYDQHNNMLEQISQNWENEAWVNTIKTTNTYSESNYKTLELVERWNDSSTKWENRLKTSFGYDKKGNKITTLSQEFLNDQWTNVSNFKYTYDGKHLTEYVEQEWKNDAWLNRQRLIYTYNSNGDQTLELNQKWNPVKNWFNAYYMLDAFDNNFVQTDESNKSWNIVTDKDNNNNYSPFITGDSTHYYVHSIATELAQHSVNPMKDDILIYPNPSNGIFTVAPENHLPIRNLEIYDATGQLILKQQSNQVTIPRAIPGIYYIKLEQDTARYSQRIVVQ
jgi:hypothetical protein